MSAAPVIVFGATGATGSTLARLLAEQGRTPFLVGRDRDRTDALARDLGCRYALADLTEEADVIAAVEAAAEVGGGAIAGLAVCAGSIVMKPIGRSTAADFEATWRLNVLGPALAVKAAAPALKQGQGPVVLFSSIAARHGFPNHAVIGSAKAAVEGLAVSLAAELAPHVRVNAVAPSLSRTHMAEPFLGTEAMAKSIAGMHPLPRLGEAADLAHAAAWLLGPESGWVTGHVLPVDGGRAAMAAKGK